MEEKIEIIITDDKVKYRHLIREMLDGFPVTVLAEAENGQELLALLRKKNPDIVLLDLEMPVMDGNKTLDALREQYPAQKVIILSSYYEGVLIENYIERGAKGYIPKDELEPHLLMNALSKIKAGGVFVFEKQAFKQKFTTRQKEIMPLMFEGLTNAEIADEISISKRAVEKQRHKIYQKTGVEKVIDFYKYAFSKGLQFLGRHH